MIQTTTSAGIAQNPLLYAVPIGDFEFYVNDMACIGMERKQYRFPKSKKVRIRKKWAKRPINFKMMEVHKVITMGRKMYVSTKTFEKLKMLPQA